MPEIKIKIKDCSECPFFKSEKVYTSDSWDDVSKWTCTKKNKIITGYHEQNDKETIPIWCPILIIPEGIEGKPKKRTEVCKLTGNVVIPLADLRAEGQRSKGQFIISRAQQQKSKKLQTIERQPKTPIRNVRKSSGKKTCTVK